MASNNQKPRVEDAGNRTSEQMRAEHALKIIRVFRESDQMQGNSTKKGPIYGNFRAYVENLPALIVMNGLGQALASELAMARIGEESRGRGKREPTDLNDAIDILLKEISDRNADERSHEALYLIVQDWMRKGRICAENEDLMEALVSGNQNKYVLAQAETLAYLEWLKKFSQAFLKKGGRGEGDEH